MNLFPYTAALERKQKLLLPVSGSLSKMNKVCMKNVSQSRREEMNLYALGSLITAHHILLRLLQLHLLNNEFLSRNTDKGQCWEWTDKQIISTKTSTSLYARCDPWVNTIAYESLVQGK